MIKNPRQSQVTWLPSTPSDFSKPLKFNFTLYFPNRTQINVMRLQKRSIIKKKTRKKYKVNSAVYNDSVKQRAQIHFSKKKKVDKYKRRKNIFTGQIIQLSWQNSRKKDPWWLRFFNKTQEELEELFSRSIIDQFGIKIKEMICTKINQFICKNCINNSKKEYLKLKFRKTNIYKRVEQKTHHLK